MNKKFKLLSLLLFPLTLFINLIASKNPTLVEKYYSLCIDKYIVQFLSKISGIFPFSLYELTMYIIAISIILFFISLIIIIFKDKKRVKSFLCKSLLNILSIISIFYFLFIILWGLNYNRLPLKDTLIDNYNIENKQNISNVSYNNDDLIKLYTHLINKVNEIRNNVAEDNNSIIKANTNYKGIINRAHLGYKQISNMNLGTNGNYSNPKYVISSNIMCYTGITGIYFPFTGEANVNIAIPDIYIPSTTLHEMAHQRGFASEDEANFLGYITSINHPDVDFKYSGYILALNHTSSALSKVDHDTLTKLNKTISNDVKRDLINNKEFWKKYEGTIDNVSNEFNNTYLKANGIKEGVQSYGKMVDLLLTYYKLYPYE